MATLEEMGDISNLCQVVWNEWVYFRKKTATFPFQKQELGRCLGPTNYIGNDMCQWVIQQNGQMVPRQTLRRLRLGEITVINQTESNKRADFDAEIK